MNHPSNGFTFGSWNAGSKTEDYHQLIRDDADATRPNISELNPSLPEDKEMLDSIDSVRNKLLGLVAQNLASKADVYALQEVNGDERDDIQAFKDSGFEIIRPLKKNSKYASQTDTAIAINPHKFSNIENRSFWLATGTDFAVAVAIEKATGRKIAFVSGHIPGFNLEAEKEIIKEQAAIGDYEIENMIAQLKHICFDCDSVMIGADTNSIPEIYEKRSQLLKEAGFEVHRTGLPTSQMSRNFDGKTATLQARELDYIFVDNKKPKGFFNFLRNLFKKEELYTAQIVKDKTSLSLNPNSSPSDHIPIFVRIEQVQKKSFMESLSGIFSNLTGRVRNWFSN